MADSNIQTLDTVKPITLDEYQERTAHLQENTTSLLSTIADRQVQAAGLATQAASLASEVNAVAEQASLSFTKKTWTDNATSGTPITAAELNRLENAISSLTTAVNNLQDSVSREVGYQFLYGKDFSGPYVAYRKKGFLVEMSWNFIQESSQLWNAGTLPVEFRPTQSFLAPAVRTSSSGIVNNSTAEVEVQKSGKVVFISAVAVSQGHNIGHCIWIAN